MRTSKKLSETKTMPPRPHIVGIGLIALDMVVGADPPEIGMFAGGTCGNVLAILSYLGWKASPMSRIMEDLAGKFVKEDLAQWGADLSYISLKPTTRTPVIVQKIRKDRNGIPFHTFSFHCPSCNRRFPGFQPVPASSVDSAFETARAADVLFIDRASKSSLLLAEATAKAGGIVFFEPASIDHSKSSTALLELANIVKYSHDRIDELPQVASKSRLLEIQTLGRGGLRFKMRGDRKWRNMEAEPIWRLVDASGSGDWLTAGFLYGLYGTKSSRRKEPTLDQVVGSLVLGQKLAVWNCSYRGARGGMYTDERTKVASIIAECLSGSAANCSPTSDGGNELDILVGVCVNCSGSGIMSERAIPKRSLNQRA